MIPLKMLMIGLAWQLGVMVVVMVTMLTIGYVFLHKIRLPITWPWVFIYSIVITVISEVIYKGSIPIDESVPFHIEVLLPAFVLGCIIAYPKQSNQNAGSMIANRELGMRLIETKTEKRIATFVAGTFMLLVGLSMPLLTSGEPAMIGNAMSASVEPTLHAGGVPDAESRASQVGSLQQIGRITASQESLSWGMIAVHVLLITFISNLGKMFPAFCYRREAHWRERLSVAVGMWPRGEVGAGVLVISMSYGIGGLLLLLLC